MQIVHGGSQALPLYYQNDGFFLDDCGATNTAKYSKVAREFESPQNWITRAGRDLIALSLWVRGQSSNAEEGLFVEIEDSAGHVALLRYEGTPNPVARTSWTEWRIDLADVSAAGVDLSNVKKLRVGVGDPASIQMGGTGILYVDDISLHWIDGQ
jgi:hypothetical protein